MSAKWRGRCVMINGEFGYSAERSRRKAVRLLSVAELPDPRPWNAGGTMSLVVDEDWVLP